MRTSLIASFLIHAGAVAALLGVAVRSGASQEAAPVHFEFAIQSETPDAESLREPEHSAAAPAAPDEQFPAVREEDPAPVTEVFTVRPLPAMRAPQRPQYARLAHPLRDPRAAPAAPAPAPAKPQAAPIRIPPPAFKAPRPLEGGCPRPAYPPRALDLGLEGVVHLRARVSAEGDIDACEILVSSGHSSLDEAALEAVRKWRFRPARRGEVGLAHWLRIPIRFRLTD